MLFGEADIGKQVCGTQATHGLDKLLIQIDLAGIAEIEISHVLTWIESNQAVAEKIIVSVDVGGLRVVAVGQLIALGGQVL